MMIIDRDPRGFAVKFYTEEGSYIFISQVCSFFYSLGNWDMVANNTPVFFIRDPVKFPGILHKPK